MVPGCEHPQQSGALQHCPRLRGATQNSMSYRLATSLPLAETRWKMQMNCSKYCQILRQESLREKSLRLLRKVKVHPYRSTYYPRNIPWGPFVGPGRLCRMVHPSHRPFCKAGKRVTVRSSRVSRNLQGAHIPGAIRAVLGCIKGRLLGRFSALLFTIGV